MSWISSFSFPIFEARHFSSRAVRIPPAICFVLFVFHEGQGLLFFGFSLSVSFLLLLGFGLFWRFWGEAWLEGVFFDQFADIVAECFIKIWSLLSVFFFFWAGLFGVVGHAESAFLGSDDWFLLVVKSVVAVLFLTLAGLLCRHEGSLIFFRTVLIDASKLFPVSARQIGFVFPSILSKTNVAAWASGRSDLGLCDFLAEFGAALVVEVETWGGAAALRTSVLWLFWLDLAVVHAEN